MLDLQQAVQLVERDVPATESGAHFRVNAAHELLYEAKGKSVLHLLDFEDYGHLQAIAERIRRYPDLDIVFIESRGRQPCCNLFA